MLKCLIDKMGIFPIFVHYNIKALLRLANQIPEVLANAQFIL